MTHTPRSSFRLSPTGKALAKRLSDKLGINMTAVVEQAIRKLAEAEGVNTVKEDEMARNVARLTAGLDDDLSEL